MYYFSLFSRLLRLNSFRFPFGLLFICSFYSRIGVVWAILREEAVGRLMQGEQALNQASILVKAKVIDTDGFFSR